MEQNQSLFSLSIDPVTKAHLSEAARWARFLAIVGFIFLGIFLAQGAYISFRVSSATAGMTGEYNTAPSMWDSLGVGIAFVYLIISIIWFFIFLFTLRFASNMKIALNGNDQNAINVAFQNLKILFRYI